MTTTSPTMRAATVGRYGAPEVIRLTTVPVPRLRPGEVRVRVHATAITAADVRLRSGVVPRGYGLFIRAAFGLTGPRRPIPGSSFSGVVEAIAPDVHELAVGDRVLGIKGFGGGAHAEQLTIAARGTVLRMPPSLSFEEGAAFSFGGLTAADFLIDKGRMHAGEHLAVVGATGSVGSAALAIGRHLGLTITALASPANHALARSLGADRIHDYATTPLEAVTPPGGFDGILDVMGVLPRAHALSLLRPRGRLMPVTGTLLQNLGAALRPMRGSVRITGSTTSDGREELERLLAIHVAGGYRPIVGQTLPFTEIVEAHRIAERWHKRGNLVLRVAEPTADAPRASTAAATVS